MARDLREPAPAAPPPTPPGNDAGAQTADEGRRTLVTWLWRLPVIAALGGAAFGLVQAYRVHFAKEAPDRDPSFEPAAPVEVAPLTAFASAWDAVDFAVAGVPCVAVRLPAAVPGGLDLAGGVHLAAYSRVCTHLACIVELNRDTEVVAFAFNHRSDRPSLTCACHYSVFDPQGAGRAVSGPAVRPLPRARLRLLADADAGDRIVADGIERAT